MPDGLVTGTISGSSIVLEFAIDNSGGVERFEGTVSGSAMGGTYWSAERSAPPDPPTGLRAETLSSTEIGLSWTDNSDNETGFRVEIRCCNESFHELGVTGENETAGVAGGLTPSTTFEFRVQAIGAAGASGYSNVTSATTDAGATLTSLTPNTGYVGTRVTIAGVNLGQGGPQQITVGGVSATEFIETASETAVTLLMPNAGQAADHDVIVFVDGQATNPLQWTQLGDGDPSDPENDDPATAPTVVLPFNTLGSFSAGDVADLWRFTLATAETVALQLDWNSDKDLDVYVTDPTPSNALCEWQGATTAKPEQILCSLQAGDYVALVIDYDAQDSGEHSLVSYSLNGTSQ